MNPKEAAEQIVEKYSNIDWMGYSSDYGYARFSTDLLRQQSKSCAILHCQGIIEVVISAWDKLGCGEIGELKDYIPYIFWNKVLNEINKL